MSPYGYVYGDVRWIIKTQSKDWRETGDGEIYLKIPSISKVGKDLLMDDTNEE